MFHEGSLNVHESDPQLGLTTNLSFNHILSKRIDYRLELGYQIDNNHSILMTGTAHNPGLEHGDYSMHFLCLNILPRVLLFQDLNIGFFTGLSIKRLIHAQFTGNVKFWSYIYGDPTNDFLTFDGNVDKDITAVMKGVNLDILLGFDYKYSINETITITLDAMFIHSIKGISDQRTSSGKDIMSLGGSITAGLLYSLGKKKN